MESLIRASHLIKTYKKESSQLQVVKDVSIEIKKSETLAIIGASGAGKSTLLHLLGGLDRPDQGTVLWGPKGQDITRLNDDALADFRNRSLGFVFQFHYLMPDFTALENVMMPLRIRGVPISEARKQAQVILSLVGLDQRGQHFPSELSGGEQQRVAVARAIVGNPEVLFADELTGNLDTEHRDRIMDILLRLNQQLGLTIVLVTHDAEVAGRMGRTVKMKDGQLGE